MKSSNPQSVVDQYPKHRKPLPPEYQAIYASHYLKNREGKTRATSLSQKMEAWLHHKVARDVKRTRKDISTLEIGAGTLNQLAYEPNVQTYDIVEPFSELFEGSDRLQRVRHVYGDIKDIDSRPTYDRITSVATFEHLVDLPDVVAKAASLLTEKGHLRVAIPNEGTVLWKLGTMVTGREYKKLYGLDYQVLMKFEHVNTADEIEAVLEYFFGKTRTRVCGIHRKLAFYRFIDCCQPRLDVAQQYLAQPKSRAA